MNRIRDLFVWILSLVRVAGAGGTATEPKKEVAEPEFGEEPAEGTNWAGLDPDDPDREEEEEKDEEGDESDEKGEDEEEEEGEEEEEEGDDDEDEEEEEEEEGDEDEGDTSSAETRLLEQTVQRQLEDEARKAQAGRFRMDLDKMQLTEDGMKRFQKALESEEDDSKAQASAVFEIAMDAVAQVLQEYHTKATTPVRQRGDAIARRLVNAERMDEFLETPEGGEYAKSTKFKRLMAEQYEKDAQKYGPEAADSISFVDRFRLVAGRPGKGKRSKKASGKGDKARSQALRQANAPRGRSRTSARKRQKRTVSEERATFEHIERTSRPFFTLE